MSTESTADAILRKITQSELEALTKYRDLIEDGTTPAWKRVKGPIGLNGVGESSASSIDWYGDTGHTGFMYYKDGEPVAADEATDELTDEDIGGFIVAVDAMIWVRNEPPDDYDVKLRRPDENDLVYLAREVMAGRVDETGWYALPDGRDAYMTDSHTPYISR